MKTYKEDDYWWKMGHEDEDEDDDDDDDEEGRHIRWEVREFEFLDESRRWGIIIKEGVVN